MKRLRFRLAAPGLPPRLAGFRFTHLSDLHCGHVDSRLDRLADAVNAEEPEAVCITGDFINRSRKLDPILHLVSRLRTRYGIWVTMGNWERNWRLDEDAIRYALAAKGATLLNNEAVPAIPGDESLYVVGLDDPFFGEADLDAALHGLPERAVKVMLSHHMASAFDAAKRGVLLSLTGHTHGGQFNLPFVPKMWLQRMEREHVAGLFDLGGGYLFVSRGLGTTGPHMRIRCESEIATFSLWPVE